MLFSFPQSGHTLRMTCIAFIRSKSVNNDRPAVPFGGVWTVRVLAASSIVQTVVCSGAGR